MAMVDYYLKIDGIDGESKDGQYPKHIQLESFSWGETQMGTGSDLGGGHGAGKVQMQDFHFVMKMNKASPSLFFCCASGKHIPKAVLYARKAGGKQETYLTVTFSDLVVSSYQTGGSAHGDVVPTDQISLNFAQVEIEYKEQNEKGGMVAAPKAGWNVKKNQKV